jgi:hypothetical protein
MAGSKERGDEFHSTVERVGRRGAQVATWAFDHYISVAGLVAAAATTFYGLAYGRFYAELSLTPEQVGMTPAQILTQSAVGGMTMTVLIAVAIFCALLLPVVPVRLDWGYADPGSWHNLAGNAALTLLGGLFLDLLVWAVGLESQLGFGFSYISLLVLLLVSFRIRRNGWHPVLRPRPLRFELERYLTALVTIALPIALLYTSIATFNSAKVLGEEVAEGVADADEDLSILDLPILGIEVEPALVHWEDPTSRPERMPLCALYLGTSNGDAVFFDPGSRSSFHVSASDVVIQVRTDLSNCDGPINVRAPDLLRRDDGTLVCHRGAWESYVDPRFTYFWVFNGPRYREPEYRRGRTIRRSFLDRHDVRVAHCQVDAASRFGRDFAVSRSLVVNRR